ncbi:hypothetical protein Tco_0792693 [Tanacetum coccineum]
MVTNAQLQAMIDQGVTAALAARDANRNGDDNHTSGYRVPKDRTRARACTLPDKKISTFADSQVETKRNFTTTTKLHNNIPMRKNVVPATPLDWHYKSDCPELKNETQGNPAEVREHMEWLLPLG